MTIRSFIAIELDDSLKHTLKAVQVSLARELPEFRWVDVNGIHLTLKFLGEVEESKLKEVHAQLAEICQTINFFTIRLKSVGCFLRGGGHGIVWVGVEELVELSRFHQLVEESMNRLGFEKEKQRFKPHLTLGRSKTIKDKARLHKVVEKRKDCEIGVLRVDSVSLMKSELRPQGARYTQLGVFLLKS